jgi:hypothetical protein
VAQRESRPVFRTASHTCSACARRTCDPTVFAACFCLFVVCCSLLSGCNAYVIRGSLSEQPGQPGVSISISPITSQITSGQTVQFVATITGEANTLVSWAVNGAAGGNSSVGTVSSSGLYLAPSSVPIGGSVTVSASSVADSSESANALVIIRDVVTVNPTFASVAIGTTIQFVATLNGIADANVVWSVGGVPGGDAALGTISASGEYSAPAVIPNSSVTVTAVDPSDSLASAAATISVFDPAIVDAHEQWLDGVADAAAPDGCTDISVQQEDSESVADVINRFGLTASEGSCLVLWPISTDPSVIRYSFAWGGTIDGKDILYISDVSQMRIWNAENVTGP